MACRKLCLELVTPSTDLVPDHRARTKPGDPVANLYRMLAIQIFAGLKGHRESQRHSNGFAKAENRPETG
jgi:hypothetical protein